MNTIAKINHKFSEIENMNEALATMRYVRLRIKETGAIDRNEEQIAKLESQIKVAVAKLAAELEFTIEISFEKASADEFMRALCDLRGAWERAKEALHCGFHELSRIKPIK